MTTKNPLILSNGLISEMTAGDAITASASIIISVLNQTGATLTKGQAVYISGANGDNPTVTLASASAEATSSKTLGLVYADIANGNIGAVVTSGLFIGIDTSTATAGQSVWLSSTPGGLVFGSQPTQPLHGVFIGKVARVQQNNGSIFVTIQNGYEISELHDVLITSPANNNLLAYDSENSLWKNVSAIDGVSVGSTTAATGAFTTLSASSTVTLSGGTANGVLYLNGSKAATSGSALTFDGSELGVTGNVRVTSDNEFRVGSNATYYGSLKYDSNTGNTVLSGRIDGYPIQFNIGGSEQMRLNSTGLGIGTSSPEASLHNNGINGRTILSAGNAPSSGATTNKWRFSLREATEGDFNIQHYDGSTYNTNLTISYDGTFRVKGAGTAGSTDAFQVSGSAPASAVSVDSSGNLLVGGSNSLLGSNSVIINGGTDTTSGKYSFLAYHTNSAFYFGLNNNGYVQASAVYGRTTASAANVNVDTSGYLTRSTSALKYKQDIRDIERIDIKKFRPVRYKSKCENDNQTLDHFGIIADEVDSVGIKELVNYSADGEIEGFQYERLTVVLLKEIQELKAELDTLKSQLGK